MNPKQDLRIFLVDDDPFCLSIYQQYLTNQGYAQIQLFDSGASFLNELHQSPDIVFLDYKMDTINGFDVLKKIKRFNPDTYVVMVSGQENIQTALNALKYGAFDYIIKGEAEKEKMNDVVERILAIQESIKKERPSLLNRLFPINSLTQ